MEQNCELIGDLNGPVAQVNTAGAVAPLEAGWEVAWAIGSSARWHIAADEPSVRFRLLDDMPVTVTTMRVPGGDVVSAAATVCDASGRAVIIEFRNETSEPVSLAAAVMPLPKASLKTVAVQGPVISVDNRIALELDQPPGGTVAVDDGDPWLAVKAEPSPGDRVAHSSQGRAAAAWVVPLASGVPRRMRIPIDGGPVTPVAPREVAAGWRAVVAQAAQVDCDDESVVRAWRRGVAALVLAAHGTDLTTAAAVAPLLDVIGMPDEADHGRDLMLATVERSQLTRMTRKRLSRNQPTRNQLTSTQAVLCLRALASRRLRAQRYCGLDEWAGPLTAAAGRELDNETLEQVATALSFEAPAAAEDARRITAPAKNRSSSAELGVFTNPWNYSQAHPAKNRSIGTELAGANAIMSIATTLGHLVFEAADHLTLIPVMPDRWQGRTLDVRQLHTRHGRLSYSLRWHGQHPAFLWELNPTKQNTVISTAQQAPSSCTTSAVGIRRFQSKRHQQTSEIPTAAIEIRCGLDVEWSTTELSGEMLFRGQSPN